MAAHRGYWVSGYRQQALYPSCLVRVQAAFARIGAVEKPSKKCQEWGNEGLENGI